MMATDYQLAARNVVGSMTSLDEFNSNDGTSTSSDMSSETASLNTPNDSPYASVIEVVSSDLDMDAMGLDCDDVNGGCSLREDDFATPRPRQVPFSDASAVVDSPSKFKPIARAVVKAKTLVKALVRKRPTRKAVPDFEGPSGTIATSASSSAVPGGWRETLRSRPVMSILIKSRTVNDFVASPPSKRMLSSSSNTSTTGIYTPEDTNTPNPSLESLVPSQPLAGTDTLSQLDQSLILAGSVESPLLQNLARVMLFVPWCIAVGGAILLFPSQLDRVVFRAGYVEPLAPGLRRFQFWHDMGPDYVKIFLFTLAGAWSLSLELGALVFALVAARFVYVWQGFVPQACCLQERIGVCDMESLWLLVQDPEYLEELFELAGITEEDVEKMEDESDAESEEMRKKSPPVDTEVVQNERPVEVSGED
ncbi:hypothetical protein C8T65DRAFT_833388 [Cerioporus squamosus]|nr:hypothetical protein C8T65DRAFT_833388 [Cerioporus squamosus]